MQLHKGDRKRLIENLWRGFKKQELLMKFGGCRGSDRMGSQRVRRFSLISQRQHFGVVYCVLGNDLGAA